MKYRLWWRQQPSFKQWAVACLELAVGLYNLPKSPSCKETYTPLVAEGKKSPPHSSYSPFSTEFVRVLTKGYKCVSFGGEVQVAHHTSLHQNSTRKCLVFFFPENRENGRDLTGSHRTRVEGQILHYLHTNPQDGCLARLWDPDLWFVAQSNKSIHMAH